MAFSLETFKPAILSNTGMSLLIITAVLALRWLIVREIRNRISRALLFAPTSA